MSRVIIIGGGISGLACAWTLQRAGIGVKLIEAAEEIGGNLQSRAEDGYIYEMGPHSFLPHSDAIWKLVERLGMEDRVRQGSTAGNARFIWKDDRLHALPMDPRSFLNTGLISPLGKLRLMAEPFIPCHALVEDSAETFFIRRLGREATRWMVGPFISGVYAGDPKKLGARDAFPKMWGWERDAGSMVLGARKYLKQKNLERGERAKKKGLFSFAGGLGTLTSELARSLGERIHLGERADRIIKDPSGWIVETDLGSYTCRQLVLAVPPFAMTGLMMFVSDVMTRHFAMMEMSPVAVLHMGLDKTDAQAVPEGFGFLVPRDQGVRSLGCVFTSKLFDDRAPEGQELLSFYIGGSLDPSALALSDEELTETAVADLQKVLGRRVQPRFLKILRHKKAIPQLVPGHVDRVDLLHKLARQVGNLYLAGNYLTGVGMNDAAQSGLDAAGNLLSDLGLDSNGAVVDDRQRD